MTSSSWMNSNFRVIIFLWVLRLLSLNDVVGHDHPTFQMPYDTSNLNRSSFPADFIFGTGSSSYQYEGAADGDGRGPSIWDYFTHTYPEKIADGSNADVAVNQYYKYKEDVGMLRDIGFDAYRLSISWSRILPSGKLIDGVNIQGLNYYNNLINDLLANGIQPYVTLFHWDLPQALYDEYGGFLNPRIVDDYVDYAGICFKEFGDRVKQWITMNEPYTFTYGGYAVGICAPGRCSAWINPNCTGGDSATEPYLVAHNMLLAHSEAVKLYKEKYQAYQKGVIGMTFTTPWYEPYSDSIPDQNAARRSLDFALGWFMEPLINGDYPYSMRSLVSNRLPEFTKEQSAIVQGSFDFIGINYYTAIYAQDAPRIPIPSYTTDACVNVTDERDGVLIGPPAAMSGMYVYPEGLWKLMMYIKNIYGNPLMLITENGFAGSNNSTLSLEQKLYDPKRVDYHYGHLMYLLKSISEGANVKGYFTWSFLDDFEWYNGYTICFGISHVDYQDGLLRYPKYSASWFKRFLEKSGVRNI